MNSISHASLHLVTGLRRIRRGLLLACAALPALALAGAALAQDGGAEALRAAIRDFGQGRNQDDGAAVDRAAGEFKQLLAQEPGNPLYLSYYGSALALQARHAWAPWNKMKYAERGLDAIDKSLALLQPQHESQLLAGMPVALVTRLVALSTYVGVPDMFHRLGDARELLQRTYQSPSFGGAPDGLKAAFAYQAALIARRDGKRDAELEQLRQVLTLGPSGEEAPKASARLREIGQ